MKKKNKHLVKKIFEKLEKDPSKITEILKESYLKNIGKKDKEIYEELTKKFLIFKTEIEKISKRKLLTEEIKALKLTGQDRKLNEDEQRMFDNMMLGIEKQSLIIHALNDISSKKMELNKTLPLFQEYVISNFYRTMCEVSLRLFTEILLVIVDYNLSLVDQKNGFYKQQEKYRRDIIKDSIGLDTLRSILGGFDKRLIPQIGLVQIIDRYFLYIEGEGFSLRNKIAHEKLSLKNVNSKQIIDEILKVNMLNQIVIKVFYLDALGSFFTKEDLTQSKNIFGDMEL